MKAKLFLSSLHQDLIDEGKINSVREFEKISPSGDGVAWTLCCNAFCCILDFSKFQNPVDLVSRKEHLFSWHIRQEKSGGLLWNPDTNQVFELDKEAYHVLLTLQEGGEFDSVKEKYDVDESAVHELLAEISQKGGRASASKG